METQINYFREVSEESTKEKPYSINSHSQNIREKFNSKEMLETNIQTSRLLTQGNKENDRNCSPDKENRRFNYDPPNIRVIESCISDEDHLERRVGSIKIFKAQKRTPLRNRNI